MSEPWGYKLTASVYVEGTATSDDLEKAMDWAAEDFLPNIVFAGVSHTVVKERPQDQIAT